MSSIAGLPRGLGEITRSLSEMQWFPSERLEQDRFAFAPGRLFLGATEWGYVGFADDRHALTVAGSRAGKGTSLIVPNLLFWPGSCIAIDPKGELATITASRRGGRGSEWSIPMSGEAYALDPFGKVTGPAASYRARFNPLADLDPDTDEGFERAGLVADALVIQQEGAGSHWTLSARSFLRALVLYLAKIEPHACNLIRLRELLLELTAEQRKSDGGILTHMMDYPGPIRHGAAGLIGKPSGERGSVLSTCDVQTEFLEGGQMRDVLTGHDFRLEDMKTRRMTVYLCLPANRLATHGRWFRLMVTLAMEAMERTGPLLPGQRPVLFCLDEFAALGHLAAVEKAAGQIASFGVKLWPILQDLTQLQRDYGVGWETFMGNAGTMMFWGNSDLATCRHVSERLGVVPVETEGTSTATSTTTNMARNDPDFDFGAFLSGFDKNAPPRSQPVGSTSEATSTTTNTAAQIGFQLVPMLTPGEYAWKFGLHAGRMVCWFGGGLPVPIQRCEYFDPQHERLFMGLYDPAPGHGLPSYTADQVRALRGTPG